MNTIIQVFDSTMGAPLAESDIGGRGESEAIAGLAVEGTRYFIQLREVWVMGRRPTENVSDNYSIKATLFDPERREAEPNDAPITASQLSTGVEMAATVSRPGDIDFFCAPAASDGPTHVVVRVPDGLDLILVPGAEGQTVVDADDGTQRVELLGDERCFSVRAAEQRRAYPLDAYRVISAVGQGSGDEDN